MKNYVLFISLMFTVLFSWGQGLHTQGTQMLIQIMKKFF